MNPDPTFDNACAYCGEAGQECCGTACYAAGTSCGGNAAVTNTLTQCVAPCGAPGEGACSVNAGSGCQPGSQRSGNICIGCGANGEAPCTAAPIGCERGLVEAVNPKGGNICVSACGNQGQYPCTSGSCTGGGIDSYNILIYSPPGDELEITGGLCQLNPSCGHSGVGCCNAGSAFQGGDCYDGSLCSYSGFPGLGSWQCQGASNGIGSGSSSGGGSSSGTGSTCGMEGYPVCTTGNQCEESTPLCNASGYCEPPECDTCDPDDQDACCLAYCQVGDVAKRADGRAPVKSRQPGGDPRRSADSSTKPARTARRPSRSAVRFAFVARA